MSAPPPYETPPDGPPGYDDNGECETEHAHTKRSIWMVVIIAVVLLQIEKRDSKTLEEYKDLTHRRDSDAMVCAVFLPLDTCSL